MENNSKHPNDVLHIKVQCSCGKKLRALPQFAGKRIKCPVCGLKIVVPANASRMPPTAQQDAGNEKGGITSKTLLGLWTSVGVFALVCVLFLFWYSQSSHQARIKSANDRIAEAVATANQWIAGNSKINLQAIEQQLVSALQNEDATMKSEGEVVLALVQTKLAQRNATSIFENAKLRLEENKVSQAVELLKKYVNDPYATAKPDAQQLLNEAETANSDAQAISTLLAMTKEDFERVKSTDEINDGKVMHPAFKVLRKATIQRNFKQVAEERHRIFLAEEDRLKREQLACEHAQEAVAFSVLLVSSKIGRDAAEKFLHEGRFAEGETSSLLALDANPTDDETRFGLGVIQFVRAVENLGKALFEYGAVSENATQPFLRLPVPRNMTPSAISYKALGRVLDAFASDLSRAESTLAGIKDDKVKLRLRLAKVSFDFAGTGKDRTTLIELLNKLNSGRFDFQKNNPDFRVHFDRGDVAWLRSYCHLLSAMVEGYRAVDEEAGFEERVNRIFPRIEAAEKKLDTAWFLGLKVVDPPRLRRLRLHLVAVCELNRDTWEHIRKETDNDYEWLPHPMQTDQLGLPLSNERIEAWLGMMAQMEGLLKGESLVPGKQLNGLIPKILEGHGLNFKKVLDDPPADLFNINRLNREGIDAKYLEAEKDKQEFDTQALDAVFNLFNGPFGFAYAARLN